MIIYWTIFLFYGNLGSALNKDVIQPDSFIVTNLGQNVSLTCFCQCDLMIRVSWFKQTVGQKPLLMASSYYRSKNSYHFTKNFNETKRLSVNRGIDSFNLTISKTESGDSATYYCSAMEVGNVKFGEGTFLIVKDSGSNSMYVLHQPLSESAKAGDTVTLNCTIHTETCAGEHSVYWFRHGSGESRPGIIYTHGDRSDQSEKIPEAGSPRQSCVYNLPKRSLSLSDAGTYYCAVASCGEILLGNGTKLGVEVSDHLGDRSNLLFLIIISCLTTTVILSVIVNVILCVRMKRSPCEHCAAGTPFQQSHYGNPHFNTSDQQLHGDDDALNYTALKFTDKKSTKPRRQRREQREQREDETIYSGVSYQVRM
uniref:Ig-like domain-containing protein n=1 Tax=Hucho hucho TaxID=62062 RepID=A0A4W5JLM6_9TELE